MLGINIPEWAELAILGVFIYGGLIIARHPAWRGALRALRHDDTRVKARSSSMVRRVNMIAMDPRKARVRT